MPQDTRLARLLHVLIHMHLHGGSTTSETISLMLRTNAVVVRRTMAGLREAGYVISTGGRRGGWTLAANFDQLTVADIHRAVAHQVFAFGPASDNPQCPVEAATNRFLDASLTIAEQALVRQFATKKLVDFAGEVLGGEG